MAIYHFHTKIIKSSKGKCAVASAAYQSASELYSERLGYTFSYVNKEEVVHAEIILPENAPAHFKDREHLWNAIERVQNKSNSRYARQFDFAIPAEWSKAECIERTREFISKTFVEAGMAVDWAVHFKDGNPHVHAMAPVRGFNKDGTWASMEKKVYALDENGNKIPEIDAKTGLQKVRIKKKNGKEYEEKLWKRETVQSNTWNKRSTLLDWRKAWADYANQFLAASNKIDHRSYEARGIEKIPTVHEGPGAREMDARGITSYKVEENRQRLSLNAFLDKARQFVEAAKLQLAKFREIIYRRKMHGLTRNSDEFANNRGVDASNRRISANDSRVIRGDNRTSIEFGATKDVSREGGVAGSKIRSHKH